MGNLSKLTASPGSIADITSGGVMYALRPGMETSRL